jgi:type II secretory pathway pseudopilin PulG
MSNSLALTLLIVVINVLGAVDAVVVAWRARSARREASRVQQEGFGRMRDGEW